MSEGGLYLQVFLETIWVGSIVPMSSDATYFAMAGFGGHNMLPAFILAVIGATLGQSFNWLVGRFLLHFKEKGRVTISEYWYGRVKTLFNKYGIFLLLLSWAPLCNFLPVVAGFVGTPYRFVLPLVAVGQAVHYGLRLF